MSSGVLLKRTKGDVTRSVFCQIDAWKQTKKRASLRKHTIINFSDLESSEAQCHKNPKPPLHVH